MYIINVIIVVRVLGPFIEYFMYAKEHRRIVRTAEVGRNTLLFDYAFRTVIRGRRAHTMG